LSALLLLLLLIVGIPKQPCACTTCIPKYRASLLPRLSLVIIPEKSCTSGTKPCSGILGWLGWLTEN